MAWKIVVAKTFREMESLRSLWEKMRDSEPMATINANIDYYLSVLKGKKDTAKPHVIVLYRNGKPETMAIGRIERWPIVCRIGYKTIFKPSLRCLVVAYGGILGQQSNEAHTVLIQELMRILRSREADVIFFNNLRVDSSFYQTLRNMAGFVLRSNFLRARPHWVMNIPENIEAFYQARSKKHRGNLRRSIRKLEAAYPKQVRMDTCCREDGFAAG